MHRHDTTRAQGVAASAVCPLSRVNKAPSKAPVRAAPANNTAVSTGANLSATHRTTSTEALSPLM
jgi:hypothetical protein